jgi:micrococcal nuclease
MKIFYNIIVLSLVLCGILSSASCAIQEDYTGELPEGFVAVRVIKVIDGDTIEVAMGSGAEAKVRLIGVDTPETRHPSKGKEPFGPEATAFTKDALDGQIVYLEKDVSETDRYDRLLRYVWTDAPLDKDSEEEMRTKLFNARLVAEGYAQALTYPPDVARAEFFLQLQREARESGFGLWALATAQVDATTSASRDKKVTHAATISDESEYIGNANSKKFHRPECDSVPTIKDTNVIVFQNREDAVEAGFIPCKACNP